MAVQQTDSEQAQAKHQQQRQQIPATQEQGMARQGLPIFLSPFTLLQRFFTDGVMELFDERLQPREPGANRPAWDPQIDVIQRGNELVVRADLPGLKPDDVTVEVSDGAISISGERRHEFEEDQGSLYRFERSYGAFFRAIPLPEGAIVDQAKATFNDGVLEITVPAPSEQVSRGRRLEISRADDASTSRAKQEAKQESTRS
jgi:HSP20 family molecular chaperone IbpA